MESKDISVDLKVFESGQLRAFADVTLPTGAGDFTAKGYRVVENKKGGLFVAVPSISYEKDGQRVNKPTVEASKALQKQIAEKVMEEYKKAKGV